VTPERLRIVGRGTPPISVWPTSIKSPSGVTATRFVRLPSGPASDHASVPGAGVETVYPGRLSSYLPCLAMTSTSWGPLSIAPCTASAPVNRPPPAAISSPASAPSSVTNTEPVCSAWTAERHGPGGVDVRRQLDRDDRRLVRVTGGLFAVSVASPVSVPVPDVDAVSVVGRVGRGHAGALAAGSRRSRRVQRL
jgi:hypothetical protein